MTVKILAILYTCAHLFVLASYPKYINQEKPGPRYYTTKEMWLTAINTLLVIIITGRTLELW